MLNLRIHCDQILDQIEAASTGQSKIGNDQIGLQLLDRADGFGRVCGSATNG